MTNVINETVVKLMDMAINNLDYLGVFKKALLILSNTAKKSKIGRAIIEQPVRICCGTVQSLTWSRPQMVRTTCRGTVSDISQL